MVLASAGKLLQLNVVAGQSVSKSAMCSHKNEGDERRSGKEKLKKEMDNPSFLWRHKADILRHVVKLSAYIALETLKQQIGLT